MKINNQYPKIPVKDQTGVKGADQEITDKTKVQSQKPSEVKTSGNQDFTINKVRGKIDVEPDVNMEKVKALKAQIKKGEYKVDTEQLAGNLLKDSNLEDI